MKFRVTVQQYVQKLGYACYLEKGSFGSRNVIIGNPETAKYLVTAHYDTCAALPFPNLITPCNFFWYILYQVFAAIVMLIPAIGIGVLVGIATKSVNFGNWTGIILMWATVALMLIGPANKNNANDNTSGVVTVLEIAKTLPENLRSKVCFVLFDLEEAGLIGSSAYRSQHKKISDHQIVLNLDCVGDGDEIMLFPNPKLKKEEKLMQWLRRCRGKLNNKTISIREKGFAVYPSDQKHFPYGIGICALRKSKLGLYMARIHTKRDTILEQTNVNILRAALITLISCDAVQ